MTRVLVTGGAGYVGSTVVPSCSPRVPRSGSSTRYWRTAERRFSASWAGSRFRSAGATSAIAGPWWTRPRGRRCRRPSRRDRRRSRVCRDPEPRPLGESRCVARPAHRLRRSARACPAWSLRPPAATTARWPTATGSSTNRRLSRCRCTPRPRSPSSRRSWTRHAGSWLRVRRSGCHGLRRVARACGSTSRSTSSRRDS